MLQRVVRAQVSYSRFSYDLVHLWTSKRSSMRKSLFKTPMLTYSVGHDPSVRGGGGGGEGGTMIFPYIRRLGPFFGSKF